MNGDPVDMRAILAAQVFDHIPNFGAVDPCMMSGDLAIGYDQLAFCAAPNNELLGFEHPASAIQLPGLSD